MAKRKLIKHRSSPVLDSSYQAVFNALRQFKSLSEQEAIIFIEIMKKKRITLEDLREILKDKNIKSTTTKPYAIIKNLMDAKLLFCENKIGRGKNYHPILPRDLIIDIKESVAKLDDELSLLEEEKIALEEFDEHSEILESEYEITTTLDKLRQKGYKIAFFHNPLTVQENHSLYKRLMLHNLQPKPGKFCMIAAKNDDSSFPNIAVVLINENPPNKDSTNQNRIIGNKIVDSDIFNSLLKGVVAK